MNRVNAQPDESIIRDGNWSNRDISEDVSLSIQTGEHPYVILYDKSRPMDKDDAIAMAKAILTEFKVPFCNRVKGSGASTPR